MIGDYEFARMEEDVDEELELFGNYDLGEMNQKCYEMGRRSRGRLMIGALGV